MAKLTEEQKTFLVCGFARWSVRADLMRAFEDEFGFRPDRQQLDNYNLDGWRARRTADGRKDPMKKWRPLFEQTRKDHLARVNAIPVANQAHRLTLLNKMIEDAMTKGAIRLAADLLEQAAKEAGGAFTNTREVRGNLNHKHDIEPEVVITAENKRRMLADRISGALAKAMKTDDTGEQETAH